LVGRSRCIDEVIEFVLERLKSAIMSDIGRGQASPMKTYMRLVSASVGEVVSAAASCTGDGMVRLVDGELRAVDVGEYKRFLEKALLELRMKVFDKAMETLSKYVDISGTSLYARLSALLLAYASSVMEIVDHAYVVVAAGDLPPELMGFVEGVVVVSAARFYALCRLLSTLTPHRLSKIMRRLESVVESFIGQDVAMKYVLVNTVTGLRNRVAPRTRIPGL